MINSFPFKIGSVSKNGLVIKTKTDSLFFRWTDLFWSGWLYSSKYGMSFCGFSHYSYFDKIETQGTSVDRTWKKLEGFDYPSILIEWAKSKYPGESIVVLYDINTSAKSLEFWAKVPAVSRGPFLKDVAVLRCKDHTEMSRLVRNIEPAFASAIGISKLAYIYNTMEGK